jgi:hypothetical protein
MLLKYDVESKLSVAPTGLFQMNRSQTSDCLLWYEECHLSVMCFVVPLARVLHPRSLARE